MRTLRFETAAVFEPLLQPSRYKGIWGGRGSGKSHFFAEKLIEDSIAEPGDSGEGLRSVCIREVQKDLAQSSKLLIETKLAKFGLGEADGFKVFRDVIQTPGDGLMIFKGMNDYTADSIKSLEGFKRGWWEEAQSATSHSLNLLRPTLRSTGSELWFSWNPRRKTDPTDVMLRGAEVPTGAIVVKANWRDNPWLTAELEQERQDCLRMQPDQYDHIWEGGYVSVISGAYYARHLVEARQQGRIGRVQFDPLLPIRLFCDIGGTGAKSDAFAIWPAQFVGREIRTRDYYEAVGQPLAAHLAWMRTKGYTPDRARVVLPHDGATKDRVYSVSYESAFRDAGYTVDVVPNQGAGAAAARIEAARRLFSQVWFDAETTEPGRDALGWYHEKQDENRGVGLGPEHDWASHGCFHGNTMVLTRYGARRIMDLPFTGEVLTPCGWKQYIAPRVTKLDAQLVEVEFVGGYSVRCTPDHLFLTEGGWKSAASLRMGTPILSSLTQSRSIFAALSTACGRVIATTLRAAAGFIATLGRLLSGQFPPAVTSTTGMATPPTTNWTTSNAWMQKSICDLSASLDQLMARAASAAQHDKLPQSGTAQRLGESGIGGRPRGHKAGQSGSASRESAPAAARSSWGLSARAAMRRFIAHHLARWPHTGQEVGKTSGPLLIERVKRVSERADVWDITVPDGHCFSLVNGAVVHNSDAFGLMCVAYEPPRTNDQPTRKVPTRWIR